MTNDVGHHFMCLLAIYTPSLEECIFKTFAHFKIGLFALLLLNYKSSLYILDINTLSQRSPTFLAPGTGFVEDSFSVDGAGEEGWFKQ